MARIEAKKLSVGYERVPVATGINFVANEGDYLYIVGENGSGKSTLMKTILGLEKPIDGEIIYSDGLKQKEIGYLPQQVEYQKDFPASVWEIVMAGNIGRMGMRPFFNKSDKKRAMDSLNRLEAADLKDRSFSDLSGGQKQRVLLARALCATGTVLLLDEPVAGLDPVATQQFYELVDKLNKEDKITVIMISHDIFAALKYASHVLYIDEGVPFFGNKSEFLKTEKGKMYSRLSEEV